MALPLVVVLGSENVSVEQDILDSIATVIGTDPHQTRHVPDEIASRVSAVSAWHTARVDRELLERMKNCKIVVRCGAGKQEHNVLVHTDTPTMSQCMDTPTMYGHTYNVTCRDVSLDLRNPCSADLYVGCCRV